MWLDWRLDRSSRERRGLFIYTGQLRSYFRNDRGKLLRPAAIIPSVGTICPRNRLAPDATGDALEHVIWDIDTENYFISFGAIGNAPVHETIPCASGGD